MSALPPISWSIPATAQTLTPRLTTLITTTPWRLTPTADGLQRTYRFKGFKPAMRFWNAVADECVKAKHHPEWSNVYNMVSIRWTTHNPAGLGEKDVEMAEVCEKLAKQHEAKEEVKEEVKEEPAAVCTLEKIVGEGCQACINAEKK